jgi:flavodoxin
MFYGLALDEDNQRDESNERIERWVNQLKEELEF